MSMPSSWRDCAGRIPAVDRAERRQLGMPRAPLEAAVKVIIAPDEKDKREQKADEDAVALKPAYVSAESKPRRSSKNFKFSPNCRSGTSKRVSMIWQNPWRKALRR